MIIVEVYSFHIYRILTLLQFLCNWLWILQFFFYFQIYIHWFVLCVLLVRKMFLKCQLVYWYNWSHLQHQWWRLHHMCHMCDSTYGYICYWIYGWTWVIWHLYLMNAFIVYTSSTWLLVFSWCQRFQELVVC